jgi:hypothetical protein
MNTPPPGFRLPELDGGKLDTRLRQLTPEINFPTDAAHSNKWSAELAAYNLDTERDTSYTSGFKRSRHPTMSSTRVEEAENSPLPDTEPWASPT